MNQFEDMQTFVRIVEAGSITKAAEQLNTVKSAVSRRLSELEKRLGVNLLTRTTRAQTLTASGNNYYQHCLKLIDELKEFESNIKQEHSSLTGRIKLAAPLSFGLAHLGPALRKFNQLHPDIMFDVDFNDRKVDLIEEGFDLAIRISNLNDSTLKARKITSTHLILCASPGYLSKHGTPTKPEDLLKGHVKLNYQNSNETWIFKKENGKKVSIKILTAVSSNNGNYLCDAAIADQGLIYTPDFIVYKAIKLEQLKPLLQKFYLKLEIPAYAIYPQTRHVSQRVRNLIDFLVQYYGDNPYWRITP